MSEVDEIAINLPASSVVGIATREEARKRAEAALLEDEGEQLIENLNDAILRRASALRSAAR